MADHCEEQEMEAEALTAIFDTSFEIIKSEQPFEWSIALYPVPCEEPEEIDAENNVGIKLLATLPLDYPEISLPTLSIEILKGLAPHHQEELLEMANEEAQNNEGLPSIFTICERLREWLCDNNVKGLDDISMHAQMLRKQKEAEKAKQLQDTIYESQKQEEEFTQAELEEMAVRKRRAEGTPCSRENFLIWKEKFEAEMAEKAIADKKAAEQASSGKGGKKGSDKESKKAEDKAGRLTGKQQFSGTADNLEALEAAADKMEEEEGAVEEDEEEQEKDVDNLNNVNEELFDDDEDLDDLDFDDDEDEEVDI